MMPIREHVTNVSAWLHVRSYLGERRHALGVSAAQLYPDVPRVAGTPLLARSAWLPSEPVDLSTIHLDWLGQPPAAAVTGHEDVDTPALPARPDGSRYSSYSAAVAELSPPRVFENRPTYRLLQADLAAQTPRMAFTSGSYFDGADVGDACAHEYAAVRLDEASDQPLRTLLGDPCDPGRRPTNVAITTLTIRHDRLTGDDQFLLHWRDPAAVGHAGGLFHVLPAGIFQPSGYAEWNRANDFDLWRNTIREYAEELLGEAEPDTESAPIDYQQWPFAQRLDALRKQGSVRAYCLGMGTDPLTLATDILTAVIFEASVFDELFDGLVRTNTEGRVVAGDDRPGHPFTTDTVERLTRHEPMQAAGSALLTLAWQHRDKLLS